MIMLSDETKRQHVLYFSHVLPLAKPLIPLAYFMAAMAEQISQNLLPPSGPPHPPSSQPGPEHRVPN